MWKKVGILILCSVLVLCVAQYVLHIRSSDTDLNSQRNKLGTEQEIKSTDTTIETDEVVYSDYSEYVNMYSNIDYNKVKSDLVTFFNIYDEESYTNAKSTLIYTENCELYNYFNSDVDILNLDVVYPKSCTVQVQTVSIDYENITENTITYEARVKTQCENYVDVYYLVRIQYDKDNNISSFIYYLI